MMAQHLVKIFPPSMIEAIRPWFANLSTRDLAFTNPHMKLKRLYIITFAVIASQKRQGLFTFGKGMLLRSRASAVAITGCL